MQPATSSGSALEQLSEALFATGAGQVKTVTGAGFELLRHWLDNEDLPSKERRLVLLQRINPLPPQESLLDGFVAALADTALRLWPVWYTDADFSRFDASTAGMRAMQALLEDLTRQDPSISALWGRKAIAEALTGKPPVIAEFTKAIQVQQLSLAIHRHGLIFAIVLEDHAASHGRLLALAQSAQWLARHAALGAVVMLPPALAAHPALDGILYGARHFVQPAPAMAQANPREQLPPVKAPGIPQQGAIRLRDMQKWLWPLEGRPHPFSPGEQALARALASQSDLKPLFAFNQAVHTVRGARYLADLLWAEGRIIVEVDGYHTHSPEPVFARDRQRDFELLISDYLVLRLPHDQVVANPQAAVGKIRDVVNFRHDSGWGRRPGNA